MILYFSGTGNSEYAAKWIGRALEDEVLDAFERIRGRNFAKLSSDSPWVVVVPTYAWRIPRIVQNWLENTALAGSKKLYFVMTCGGSIGNADKYLRKLCDGKRMEYAGCFPIVMPENYIAMFTTPAKEEAQKTIEQAEKEMEKAADLIRSGERFPKRSLSATDKMNSSMVNALFYPMFVHAKKFYAEDTCISCGKCVKVCPLNNIRLVEGRPVWGKDCTHCMACICRCPSQAIEYGKHSKGMPRYTCPKKI
ncbi:MAG: EFR1 family ferrodoxin [Blautia sp.]|jgi:ferredoxin